MPTTNSADREAFEAYCAERGWPAQTVPLSAMDTWHAGLARGRADWHTREHEALVLAAQSQDERCKEVTRREKAESELATARADLERVRAVSAANIAELERYKSLYETASAEVERVAGERDELKRARTTLHFALNAERSRRERAEKDRDGWHRQANAQPPHPHPDLREATPLSGVDRERFMHGTWGKVRVDDHPDLREAVVKAAMAWHGNKDSPVDPSGDYLLDIRRLDAACAALRSAEEAGEDPVRSVRDELARLPCLGEPSHAIITKDERERFVAMLDAALAAKGAK